MKIVFSDEELPKQVEKSLFLAGPSPRSYQEKNWRQEAIAYLESIHFTGTVFIPLTRTIYYGESLNKSWNYVNQVEWECLARKMADVVVYWIPRTEIMLGLTTNLEFGEDLKLKKLVYGRPEEALKCRYLDERIKMCDGKIYQSLDKTLEAAVTLLGNGSIRKDGEVNVPLHIWKSAQFQDWYSSLLKNGNKLVDFNLRDQIFEQNGELFYFNANVNVYVEKEKRNKKNECIFSRIKTSSVVAYYQDELNKETYIILAKEYRAPIVNEEGVCLDLPSGSTYDHTKTAKEIAHDELYEEINFDVELDRLIFVAERQINSTFLTHTNTIYKVKLTQEEFESLNKRLGAVSSYDGGLSGEINYLDIIKLSEIKTRPLDTNTVGTIYLALF